MHIESKTDDFLMYTLNGGKPVPSLYTYRDTYIYIHAEIHIFICISA